MPKGKSLHIGLNRVDPDVYDNWDGRLEGCINDARSMKKIADQLGYHSKILIDSDATSDRVIEEIARAAQELVSGDIFVCTYSGHGGQIDDINGDENDGLDETWVLYNRMLIDDELYSLWSQFNKGVRIFVVSDSCHSGTVIKLPYFRPKSIPKEVRERAYLQNQRMYNTLQWAAVRGDRSTIDAAILLISGCQDNQLSGDGEGNGVFTAALLHVWKEGAFSGNYEKFWKDIAHAMPFQQSPNFYTVGASDHQFLQQKPFTIDGAITGSVSNDTDSGQPSILPPKEWPFNNEEGPTCEIIKGSNRYYIVEAYKEGILADIKGHEHERNPENFYATWNDPNKPKRLTSSTFQLPDYAWNKLKKNGGRIYFRIGTTNSLTGWDNYTVSTSDLQGDKAPYVEIVGAMETEEEQPSAANTLRFPSGEEFEVVDLMDVDDGIDYSDPTGKGKIPLIRVAGRMNDQLSENFKVREFVDDANSRFARISPDLIDKLQQIRERSGRLDIKSGYRHPALNEQVGGSAKSWHIAGEAVEISSPRLTPLELAELVLDELGCSIGIGLGPDYIGIDMRGSMAVWVEPNSDLPYSQFHIWVNQHCMEKSIPAYASKRTKSKLNDSMVPVQMQSDQPRF